MMNSAPARWEELRASPLLQLSDVKEVLDLRAIAQLLERPLPEDDDSLVHWLMDSRADAPLLMALQRTAKHQVETFLRQQG